MPVNLNAQPRNILGCPLPLKVIAGGLKKIDVRLNALQ